MFCFLQVILVQVNPGETFTITTEDGHIQCIQGKLQYRIQIFGFCKYYKITTSIGFCNVKCGFICPAM